MVKHFFADTKRMPPAEFGDVQEWAEKYGLPWSQKELVNATSILAKLRGQLRPLRFEEYSLEEFTIGPVNCVVPSEYRTDVLRSWRKFVNKDLNWREILLDIWRLACLEQVAEGRTAGLYRAAAMVDHIQDCIPFLERLETIVREMLEGDEDSIDEITVNPQVIPEGASPVGCDILIGRRLLKISGERRPDMYSWTESWLTAYLFVSCGFCKPIEQIQILHPFHGKLWSYTCGDLSRARYLYEFLKNVWIRKN
jgi:hypothetical protein